MKSKAVFLLVLFLLHTVVGFGCAVVMQQEGAYDHHGESAVHQHKDGQHNHADGHEHQTAPVQGIDLSKQDPCCKKLVNELTVESKLIPASAKVLVVLPLVWLSDQIYTLSVPVLSAEQGKVEYTDYRYRPPSEDIRISIQSFQI